ncbi:MAG TPA: hypothetical protein VGG25_18745 [Streptosporangiaceae bacterium]|jgi:hypothetical protein
MIFYVWRAGSAEGVTDDDGRARDRAAEFMGKNGAARAVVETVHYDDWMKSMNDGYADRGGIRWDGRRQGGRVTWSSRWVQGTEPAEQERAS